LDWAELKMPIEIGLHNRAQMQSGLCWLQNNNMHNPELCQKNVLGEVLIHRDFMEWSHTFERAMVWVGRS
jgi:hypothetical protein